MENKSIIITGNHHTPATELISQLKTDKKYNWNIFYISDIFKSETHLVNTIIPKFNVKFFPLSSGKHNRRYLPETILGIPKTIKALFSAFNLVKTIKPDVVVSFGGYISVPVIIAAKINNIPSITHEQTLTNSLSTKINSYFVNKIALSFNQSSAISQLPSAKIRITGNLLRSQIYSQNSATYTSLSPTLNHRPLIYVTAGAQGSSTINKIFIQLLPLLSKKFTIIHHTGKLDYASIKSTTSNFPHYFPTQYVGLDDIGWVLNHASIIISRSGANTCQEIVALQKKSILIPLPQSQQNEQLLNAQYVQNFLHSTTIIIPQDQLTTNLLNESINHLQNQKQSKTKTIQGPNYQLINLIHELV